MVIWRARSVEGGQVHGQAGGRGGAAVAMRTRARLRSAIVTETSTNSSSGDESLGCKGAKATRASNDDRATLDQPATEPTTIPWVWHVGALACLSRLVLLLLAIVTRSFVPAYDTSTSLLLIHPNHAAASIHAAHPYNDNTTATQEDSFYTATLTWQASWLHRTAFQALINWDAVYFMSLAARIPHDDHQEGHDDLAETISTTGWLTRWIKSMYWHEQEFAFFPMLPSLIRLCRHGLGTASI